MSDKEKLDRAMELLAKAQLLLHAAEGKAQSEWWRVARAKLLVAARALAAPADEPMLAPMLRPHLQRILGTAPADDAKPEAGSETP